MLQCVFVMTASNITITFSILHGCDQSALLLFQIIICSSNSNVSHATNPYLMASLLIAHCTIRGIHCFLWLIYIFLESSSNLDIMTDLHTSVIICKMRERERERENNEASLRGSSIIRLCIPMCLSVWCILSMHVHTCVCMS